MLEVARLTGGTRMGPGTLYGTLKRLLAAGLIEEAEERPIRSWTTSGGAITGSPDSGARAAGRDGTRVGAAQRRAGQEGAGVRRAIAPSGSRAPALAVSARVSPGVRYQTSCSSSARRGDPHTARSAGWLAADAAAQLVREWTRPHSRFHHASLCSPGIVAGEPMRNLIRDIAHGRHALLAKSPASPLPRC